MQLFFNIELTCGLSGHASVGKPELKITVREASGQDNGSLTFSG